MFKRAKAIMDKDELDELGTRMEERKMELGGEELELVGAGASSGRATARSSGGARAKAGTRSAGSARSTNGSRAHGSTKAASTSRSRPSSASSSRKRK
jgi:hypothetical protein